MGELNTGIAPSGDLNAAPEKVVNNKKDKSNLYGVLILLIVLLAAVAGFFFLQQLRSQQEGLGGAVDKGDRRIANLSEQLSTMQNQMSTLQSQMATMQNTLATKEDKFERTLADFKEHHGNLLASAKSELYGSIEKIQNLLNRTRGDWMVADAEYLLSVANQRLNLVGDVDTALIALRAADERLRDSGNPGVFKVREKIAREINELKGVKPVDLVSMFARIRILEDQVAKLPVFMPHAGAVREKIQPVQPDQPEGKQEEISGVDEFIDSAIEDLKGLVVVRRSDRELDVVLQPEEVRIIREELKVKLEMARLALLERDSRLFLQNIQEIQAWVQTHFQTDAALTKKFMEELKAFQAVGLDIDYPDISGSLKLLESLAALRIESDHPDMGKEKTEQPAKPVSKTDSEPSATENSDRKSEGAPQ